MIVAKILLLFPLLLFANAQSGGRLGFFTRPDFRRPRPWERPTVTPIPDTPMPTEKVTAQVTDYPKVTTELPTNTFVSSTSGAPVSSAPRWFPRGRTWSRPVFKGPRPTASTPTESITFKAMNTNDHSPVVSAVSSTTEPHLYIVTPSARVPFVENHALYKDPNNFDSRGRYSPKLTHNKDDIQSDSTKTTTEIPLTTEKIAEIIIKQTTVPIENSSETFSSSSTTTTTTTTESVRSTIPPTTAILFINSDIKYNGTLNNNLDISSATEASLHLNERTTELRTTPKPLTTRETNFYSSRFPPYMSHNLNVPTSEITTIEATKGLPSSITESVGYTVPPSTNIPFVDENKRYEDINLTTNTPIPFKIISTTEAASSTPSQLYSNYQDNHNDKNNVASHSELPPTEHEEYFITATTKAPFIDEHKEYNNSFTSQLSVEYTNGEKKTSEISSKSDYYNDQIYPVYHHESEKESHYEQYSSGTREPQKYTEAMPTEVPFIDSHKMYDGSFTSGPPVEYTNVHTKTTEIPYSGESNEQMIHNIYRNNNPKWNDYKHSVTPKVFDTTQSGVYRHWHPKPTEHSVITQTIRHTNRFPYTDMTTKPTTTKPTTTKPTTPKPTTTTTKPTTTTTKPTTPKPTTTTTKPTTRYTTTTTRPSRLKDVYDVENFECIQEDAYYSIVNQCDEFIECKSGHPIQNTCPDGLHFNPAAKYGEFPCSYPSEVKCEGNSISRQPEPTSECPRRYGFFSMQDGRCDKYIMCQEGLATVMSCPAGLAFSVATSSCDWPANVPDCLPEAFQGFTCPAPELNEDGEPIRSIYKYRYNKSCKKYIACQKGHPRLLSCDSGLAFDENSESCVDEFDVTDCT